MVVLLLFLPSSSLFVERCFRLNDGEFSSCSLSSSSLLSWYSGARYFLCSQIRRSNPSWLPNIIYTVKNKRRIISSSKAFIDLINAFVYPFSVINSFMYLFPS